MHPSIKDIPSGCESSFPPRSADGVPAGRAGIRVSTSFDDELNVSRSLVDLIDGLSDLQSRLGVNFHKPSLNSRHFQR